MATILSFLGGAPVQLLYELVKSACRSRTKFITNLKNLNRTLHGLRPQVIEQMRLQNHQLNFPVEDIEELQRKVNDGIELVRQLSGLGTWNILVLGNCCSCLEPDYASRLDELNESLSSLLETLRLQSLMQVNEIVILARTLRDRQDELGRRQLQVLNNQQGIIDTLRIHQEIIQRIENNGVATSVGGGKTPVQVLQLGLVFQVLYEAVMQMKVNDMKLKRRFEDFKFTLDCLKPLVAEMAEDKTLLRCPKEQVENFTRQLEKGLELIYKSSNISQLQNMWCSSNGYIKKLFELDESLQRLFSILRLQIEDGVKEALVLVSNSVKQLEEIEGSCVLQHQYEVAGAEPQSPKSGLDVKHMQATSNAEDTLESAWTMDVGVNQIVGRSVAPNQIEVAGAQPSSSPTVVVQAMNMQEVLESARDLEEASNQIEGSKVQIQTEVAVAEPPSPTNVLVAMSLQETLDVAKNTEIGAKQIEGKGEEMAKVVLKVSVVSDVTLNKAMTAISNIDGIDSTTGDPKNETIEVVGLIEPVASSELMNIVGKVDVEMLSSSPTILQSKEDEEEVMSCEDNAINKITDIVCSLPQQRGESSLPSSSNVEMEMNEKVIGGKFTKLANRITSERNKGISETIRSRKYKYDVYLSFRGEDTRDTFTDHLYSALKQSGQSVFMHDHHLNRGTLISGALSEEIEDSRSAVVVLSQNYSSSRWCLDELEQLMKSKQQMVLPIFYHVEPSDVRLQTGSFGEAFARHEINFKDDMVKLQGWRNALTQVGGLSGWHCSDRDESELIQEIVQMISRKMDSVTGPPSRGGHGIGPRRVEGTGEKAIEEVSLIRDVDATKVGMKMTELVLGGKTMDSTTCTETQGIGSWKHDVFLSFRGKDIRSLFIQQLSRELNENCIHAFMDDRHLEKGTQVSETLLKELKEAIEESRFAVIELSPDYASSTWCLDELQMILQCKKSMQQRILPIFYGVDPSDVRLQRGSFEKIFARHEINFKDNMLKVQRWRNALTEVAKLTGWHLPDRDQYESQIIQEIVEVISGKVNSDHGSGPRRVEATDEKATDGTNSASKIGGKGKAFMELHTIEVLNLAEDLPTGCGMTEIPKRLPKKGPD